MAVVKPGRVMFEIAGVPEEVAREALRLAMPQAACQVQDRRAEETEKVVKRNEGYRSSRHVR